MTETLVLTVPEINCADEAQPIRAALYRLPGVDEVIGMLLAATGWLPPIAAAAAQSLPDVIVMLNSSRLLRP